MLDMRCAAKQRDGTGIQQQLGSTVPKPNGVQRIVHRVAGSRVGGAALSKITPPLDKFISRASGGRGTSTQLLTGLPIMMLTTTGAKTGQARTCPVLGIPFGEDYGLQSGNFGVTSVPAWVHNLRAYPECRATFRGFVGTMNAQELTGSARKTMWGRLIRFNPQYARYQQDTQRDLPVMLLERAE